MTNTVVPHLRPSTESRRKGVVVITHADTDTGHRLAQRLLAQGRRVVVTARNASTLTRLLHGRSASEILAIAADVDDDAQWARLCQSAEARFGPVTDVVDGRGLRDRRPQIPAAEDVIARAV